MSQQRAQRIVPPAVTVDDYFALDKSCFYQRGPDSDILTAAVGKDTLPLYMKDTNKERLERRRVALKAALLQQGLPEDVANDVAERSTLINHTTADEGYDGLRYNDEVKTLGGNTMLHEVFSFARDLPVNHDVTHELRPKRRGEAGYIPPGERALAPVQAAANRTNHARLKWGAVDLGDANDIEFRDDLDEQLQAIRNAYASRPPVVEFPEQVSDEARNYARSELGTEWEIFDPLRHSDYDSKEQLRLLALRKERERQAAAANALDRTGLAAWGAGMVVEENANANGGVADVNEKPRWDWVSREGPSETLKKIRSSDLWKSKGSVTGTGQGAMGSPSSPRGKRRFVDAVPQRRDEMQPKVFDDVTAPPKSIARSYESSLKAANRFAPPVPVPEFLMVDEAGEVSEPSRAASEEPSASPTKDEAVWRSPLQVKRPAKVVHALGFNVPQPRISTITFKASYDADDTITTVVRHPPKFVPRKTAPSLRTGREVVLDSTLKSEKELTAQARSRVVGSGGREGAISALFAAADRPKERRMHTEGIMAFFSCGVEGFDPVLAKEHQAMPLAELLKDEGREDAAAPMELSTRRMSSLAPTMSFREMRSDDGASTANMETSTRRMSMSTLLPATSFRMTPRSAPASPD